nr:tripartite tricarboxylate transporter permease [Phytoactinopolyspora mesophila]
MFIGLGLALGMLVGAFPGVTASMAVALAAGFTLTLEPVQGLAVLLTIYVAANFGDRVPAILINTPGTPASIATTFDGYPMARQGQAGLALTVSAFGSAIGSIVSMGLFLVAAVPVAAFALNFGPAELFALVVFGLTMMVGVSGASIAKGLLAGVFGLALATVGRDPITGDSRFTFGINDLSSGVPFIPVIIGLFGIAEILDQMLTHHSATARPIKQFGRWWPTRAESKRLIKPVAVGSGVGMVVGAVPAAGGDIAGIVGWDRARRLSKKPEEYGKGSIEGITAADTASNATFGGSLTTTMALGIPGDAVMAVMIGSMMIWGIQPGPSLFDRNPDLVVTIAALMVIATVLALLVSLIRMRGMVKLLDVPKSYLWPTILIFCVVGTYATSNNVFDVIVMLAAGVVGLAFKRFGVPAGPVVLGLLLGALAEGNLRRALTIGGVEQILTSPIAMVLLLLSLAALAGPALRRYRTRTKETKEAQY